MLADKTNTYQNKEVEGSISKKLQTPIDLHYQPQMFEKTSSFINLHDEDVNHTDQESVISKDPEIQKSICFQENEVLRLSQAFADKYYYEMKFEQYQNLLAQQQCTISKLLNEKKDLQEKLEEARVRENQSHNVQEISIQLQEYQKRNDFLEQRLQEFKLQNDDLFQQKDIADKQLEEYKRLLQKLNKEQEKLSQQFQEFKLQSVMKESEQQQLIQQLQNLQQESQVQVSSKMYTEIQKQMNEIKQQNNYLFDQLSQKEQVIEQHFQMQVANIVEKLNQEKQDLEDEFKAQLEDKDEAIHQLEMQLNDVTNQAQILYSENLQLQNQLDLLGQNYQEDIQQQANMLSQQVAEYKIVINNLENQLFVMNAEIQRRGRSASKESGSRQFPGYMRNQQRQSGGEMTFSNITPSSKQFQQQNLKN